MASAWGLSWDQAWNGAWGSIDGGGVTPPAPPPAAPAVRPSGGYPSGDRGPTKEQTRRSRIRFGLETEIIESVAARQAEALDLDAIQRRQELEGELRLRGVEFELRHLEELNARRQSLIDAEIAMRLRAIIEADDDAAFLLILAASL